MPEIMETCGDPAETRRRAANREPTSCYRCLAFRPDSGTGCHFLEVKATPPAPKRKREADQTKIW